MRNPCSLLLATLTAVPVARAQSAAEAPAPRGPTLTVHGRLEADLLLPTASATAERTHGPFDDDGELRRARVSLAGRLFGDLDYRAQMDFADEELAFRSVYLTWSALPWDGDLRLGSFKEPFGFETQASSAHVAFLERSLVDELTPGRNTGIATRAALIRDRDDDRLVGHLGVFVDPEDDRALGRHDDAVSVTGRLTATPWLSPTSTPADRAGYLHLGVAASQRWIGDRAVRLRARPELHLLPRLVDTGARSSVDHEFRLGFECAAQRGSWRVQAESAHVHFDDAVGDGWSHAATVQVSHVLTGEQRGYDARDGRVRSLTPAAPLYGGDPDARGWGALEVSLRASRIDLDASGQRLSLTSASAQWHWTSRTRLVAQVSYGDLGELGSGGDGRFAAFGLRLQLGF